MCEVIVDEASDEAEERLTQQENGNPNNLCNVTVLKQVFLIKTFILTKSLIESTFLSSTHVGIGDLEVASCSFCCIYC